MIDYLHVNPVRQGLVASAADWYWSSARWYLRGVPGPLAMDRLPAEWADAGMPDG